MKHRKKREWKEYALALLCLLVMMVISVCIGKYPLGPAQIIDIITGQQTDDMAIQVFYNLRLPRTLMAAMAGFGLSLAGGVYQNIFKNPLAAPDLIGVANGATAGAAYSIVCLGGGAAMAAISAFIGGGLAVLTVMLIASFVREKRAATYLLAGIAVKTAAESLVMAMKYFADPERQLAVIDYWAMGSFANMTMEKLLVILPLFLLGLSGLIFFRWQISLLSVGDEELKSLGMHVNRIRCLVLAFSTLTVAATVCVTGIVSFIGLIAPHVTRMLLKRSDFHMCVISGFVGAILLLSADCLARSIAGSEVPISILTSLGGVPLLVYLLCRKEH